MNFKQVIKKHYKRRLRQWIGVACFPTPLIIGIFLEAPQGLGIEAWRTAGLAISMAILWITEAVPISVTALIPLAALPLLNISAVELAASPYANPLIFLFMGGFLISIAIERWKLHKRISLWVISYMGDNASKIIAGFMIATAFFSMWLSNTATVIMIYPVAISVIEFFKRLPKCAANKDFSTALLLAVAYSGTIGGVGTLIGTPPNTLLAAFMKQNYSVTIGFFQWMLIGVPVVVLSLPMVHFVLTRWLFSISKEPTKDIKELFKKELQELGPISYPEKVVMVIACSTGTLWMVRPLLSKWIPLITDSVIAMLCGLSLFFIPVNIKKGVFILSWKDTKRLPWNIIILLGGGLSLSTAIQQSGLAQYLGGMSHYFNDWPIILTVIVISLFIRFISELASNTATIATFLPIVASIAVGLSKDPLLLVLPCVIAGSCAFILPVATPPNTIIFGSGKVKINSMMKAGIVATIIFLILIPLLFFTLGLYVFSLPLAIFL